MSVSPRFFLIILVIAGFTGLPGRASAQFVPPAPHHDFDIGVLFYEEGYYRHASKMFRHYLETDPGRVYHEKALFYLTLAELKIDPDRKEYHVSRFLNKYPAGDHAVILLREMGGRYFRDGQYDRALSFFGRAYEVAGEEEQRARLLFHMAESTLRQEDRDSTAVLYRYLADQYGESEWAPKALYAEGQLYLEMEDFDRSAAVFEELRERYPADPVTRQIGTALGEMYYRQEQFKEAIDALRSEFAWLEEEALLKAVLLVAESYNYLGQYDQAAAHYRRYINLSADDHQARPAHYGLGWVYHKQRVYHWAAESFGNASGGEDELARKALYYKAVNHKLSGRYDLALAVFEEFGDRFPTGFWVETAYYEWALTAFELGRYDLSIDVLQRLLRGGFALEEPGRVYLLLGEAYFANREYTRAMGAFELASQTVDVDPELQRQARFQRAWVLYENHAYREAARDFEAVYREQPSGELAAEALFWSADSYYNQGQWQNAARFFERFLGGYRDHRYAGAAYYSLGWCYFNLENFELAARHFETFLNDHEPPPMALFPYETDARLRLADAHYALGNYETAIGHYQIAAGSDPGGDYAIFQMANSHFRLNQSFEAVRNFRRLPRIFPDSRLREQAQYNVGYIYFQIGNYDQAIEEFHTLINRYPASQWAVRAQYQIGDAFYNAGDYEQAIEAYRIVLDEYPRSTFVVDAVNGIQFAQLAAGMEDTSLEILEAFLNQHPQTGTADQLRYRQAENLMQAGDYREAIRAFRHYLRVTTSERMLPEAWYNIAESLEQLGEVQEAVFAYETLIEQFPGSNRVDASMLHLGRIAFNSGDPKEAVRILEKLVERESRLHVEALSLLGQAYSSTGELGKADTVFREALQRRPRHDPSLIGMGRIALDRGLFVDADRYFTMVAETSMLEPGAQAQYYLGRVEQARRNHENAIELLARVGVLYPAFDNWVARSMLAMAESYAELGQRGRARQVLQDLIQKYPETEHARTAEQRLQR